MKKSIRKNLSVLVAVSMLHPLISSSASGQVTVKDAVQMALNTNPEVNARFHAFRDVYEAQGVANGKYWPRVDATAGIGRQWLSGDNISTTNYLRKGVRLELSQMIFDGYSTRNEVKQLKYSGQARYFEFLDSMESVGLESFRTYSDVLRYREMVRIAKRNLDYHMEIARQVSSRVKAGLSTGVDLEQINARIALAQSNYLTEQSNLHDVNARYLRLTGGRPANELSAVVIPSAGIPDNVSDALNEAYRHSPGFLATIDDVNAARYEKRVKKAAFSPRLDLKAYRDWSVDADGISGLQNNSVVEMRVTWNILNGGSDTASVRQYTERMFRAEDIKNKSANDLRQILSIAVNDRHTLKEQVKLLDEHRQKLDHVRIAYREQFGIAKRTLLDLLDTENEYYQSQRAYTNGYYDLVIANARVLAGMGKLLVTLGVSRDVMPDTSDIDIPAPVVTDRDLPAERL